MKVNPLKKSRKKWQSLWLNYLRRSLFEGGRLRDLIEEGVSGIMGNFSLMRRVIAQSYDYEEDLKHFLSFEPRSSSQALYEKLSLEDVRLAADFFFRIYEESEGEDGFVGVDLDPHVYQEEGRGIEEARRILREINRPNVMIKIPATREGLSLFESLISEGISVNVTHIFSLAHYEEVAKAYLRGIEKCQRAERVISLASFSLISLESRVDEELKIIKKEEALALRGKVAFALAKLILKKEKEIVEGGEWRKARERGARALRIMWVEAMRKDASYPELYYFERLIDRETGFILSPSALEAFRKVGKRKVSLEKEMGGEEALIEKLGSLGINLQQIGEELQKKELESLRHSFDLLLIALEEKMHSGDRLKRLEFALSNYQLKTEERVSEWKMKGISPRLWRKDLTLWVRKRVSEAEGRLGWLGLPQEMEGKLERLEEFSSRVRERGIKGVIVLGMGGASLAPEVFSKVFGKAEGYPELLIFDSTHPQAVLSLEKNLDLSQTLFIISSKSGTTLETLSLFRYFWEKARLKIPEPGRNFVAITDKGTPLHKLAEERKFWEVFNPRKDVGGRYSAFSEFGLLPAACSGVEVRKLVENGLIAAESSAFCVPEDKSTAFFLAASLAEIASERDKLTFLASSSLRSFPNWLEQLIAESTGKEGKGIIPVVDEPEVSCAEYGKDRFFVFFVLEEEGKEETVKKLREMESLHHPWILLKLKNKYELGGEIFSWEIAVALACSALGVNPFDQPDVELTKEYTQRMMDWEKREGKGEERILEFSIDEPEKLSQALRRWLGEIEEGDYLSLHAYLPPSPLNERFLQSLRLKLLKKSGLATTLGFGPRFLHSTGQLHKGGPNKGLFLQIVDEPEEEVKIPETDYSFRKLIKAQAKGDYQALKKRGRKVFRVNLKQDVFEGLKTLESIL